MQAIEACSAQLYSVLNQRLEPRNFEGANLGSCWCCQRARRFGQRELSLPFSWKSLLNVTLQDLKHVQPGCASMAEMSGVMTSPTTA